MAAPRLDPYNRIRYSGYPLQQTHPDRLAVIATLFGMHPAPAAGCRVLELGSGDGGNLLPLAMAFPQSRFTGIDLADGPVARARETANALGLGNVRFECMDLMRVSEDFGEFDYLIAHGVYSWVPPGAAAQILRLAARHLAAQGVAYVSYKTFPGGHIHRMIRRMMQYHTAGFAEPEQKIRQSLALVAFLAGAGGDTGTFFDRQFKQYMMTDYQALVYHDDLSEYSEPFWFRDFMSAAKSCGLEYLGEADFFEMQQHLYPEPVVQFLRNLPPGEAEQYLDFLKCRQLRQTLLCREGTGRTEPRAETVRRFFVASPAQPDENGKFHGSRGASLQTPDPAIRAVFMRLGSLWPQAVHFRDLPQLPELDEVLLEAYWSGMVRFYLDPPRFTLEPGERPIASPLARLKAMEDSIVSTLLHSVTELEDADRELIVRMDGTRRREEFPAEALKRLARMGLMLA